MHYVQQYFKLAENDTSIRTEIIAALTTFVTMAYIIFINPDILGKTGMDPHAVFVATCLVTAIGSLLIGILSNFPIALAPGIGLNVYFVYVIARHTGYTWQAGLGAVLCASVLFCLFAIFKIHNKVIQSVPHTLGLGIVIGLGALIGLVGLQNVHILIHQANTWFSLGTPHWQPVILLLLGVVTIFILQALNVPGGILLSILLVTCISLLTGLSQFHGIFSLPPSIKPTLFAFHLKDSFSLTGLGIVCAFFIAGFFDFSGVTIGVLKPTTIPQQKKYYNNFAKALCVNGITTFSCACLGSSGTTAYIENSTGIHAGGRTGLTAIIVALLFILMLFLAPLTRTIPSCATAAPLIFIAYHMIKNMCHINWKDLSEAIPTMVIAITIPLTTSVADGVGAGFLTYVLLKTLLNRKKDINLTLLIFSAIFLLYFAGQMY